MRGSVGNYIKRLWNLPKANVHIPGQASKQNIRKKYFFSDFLSADSNKNSQSKLN